MIGDYNEDEENKSVAENLGNRRIEEEINFVLKRTIILFMEKLKIFSHIIKYVKIPELITWG